MSTTGIEIAPIGGEYPGAPRFWARSWLEKRQGRFSDLTLRSLDGLLEFMGLEPLLDIDDPTGSVNRVCAIVEDPSRLAAYQRQVRDRWERYKHERRGKLADTVHLLATAAPT